MSKGKTESEIQIVQVQQGTVNFAILGTTPLIMNAMSAKVMQELLLPKGRKTAADKASTMKHDPLREYRASCYKAIDDKAPTRLLLRATAFKKAISTTALDIPGAAKSQIARLTYVNGGDYIHIYGVPQLHMAVTRSADMNRTPDVRTRAILPQWACHLSVTFTKPMLREQAIVNLLAAAGVMRGVGDWRPEKGSGTFGQFEIVSADDARFKAIVQSGGLKEQDAALAEPECYDGETTELYSWFQDEAARRGFKVSA